MRLSGTDDRVIEFSQISAQETFRRRQPPPILRLPVRTAQSERALPSQQHEGAKRSENPVRRGGSAASNTVNAQLPWRNPVREASEHSPSATSPRCSASQRMSSKTSSVNPLVSVNVESEAA